MKRFFASTVLGMVFVGVMILFVAIPVYALSILPSEVRLSEEEFQSGRPLGLPHARLFETPLVKQNINEAQTVGEEMQRFVDVKLFGVVNIKRIKVDMLPFDEVIAGGALLGFIVKTEGVIVTQNSQEQGLKVGDIIKKLDGREISSVADFEAVLEVGRVLDRDIFQIEYIRDGQVQEGKLNDRQASGRLGLSLKDETSGIGTLTYINPKNNNFASLGHRLSDFETGVNIDVRGGSVYCCNILGIEKSQGKKVGSYKSALRHNCGVQGDVLGSNFSGVFGCFFAESSIIVENTKIMPVSSRYNVKPGAAKLRTNIDGEVREFDIQIIKNRFQKKPSAKSMIVRITDKELLARTGGIIHGMSGSPIIQNGKIVGALTHVVMGNPAQGYGIYIDFIMP